MSGHIAHLKAMEVMAGTLGQFHGGDASRALVDLLGAMEREYLEEMVDGKVERVLELQVAIKQVRALRQVARGQSANPRI